MKTFWKSLLVLAIVFTIAACSSPSNNNKKETPVGTVTVTYEGSAVPSGGLTINVGETTGTFSITAEGADTYYLQSSNGNVVSVSGMTLTGAGAGTSTITALATNNSGGQNSATFTVTVLPMLTGFDVYNGNEIVSYTADNLLALTTNYNLLVQRAPTTAEDKFAWSSSPAGLTMTDYTSGTQTGKTISSTSDATYTITVTPNQAGLSGVAAKTFTVKFDAGVVNDPVTAITVVQTGDTTAKTSFDLKRGRSITLTAATNGTATGTTLDWDFTNTSIVSMTADGLSATFTAADGYNGGTASITLKARNAGNTTDATQPISIVVPDKGDTIFEWYADENPEEVNLASDGVRDYPGFRNVYIQSRGAILPINPTSAISGGAGAGVDIAPFKGMRVGTWRDTSVATPANRTPRLMIGARVTNTDPPAAYLTTTPGATDTNIGTLDLLNKPVKITIDFDDYNFNSTNWTRLLVNANDGTNNSPIGGASQYQHFNTGANAVMMDEYFTIPDSSTPKKGSFSFIIDYDAGSWPVGSNAAQFAGLSAEVQKNLEQTYVCVMFQEATTYNSYMIITGLKLEYVTRTNINVNTDANFAGFPTAPFELAKTGERVITLTNHDSAEWYVNGAQVATGKSYTVKASDWPKGGSLTAVVTVNGYLYSQRVTFTVAE